MGRKGLREKGIWNTKFSNAFLFGVKNRTISLAYDIGGNPSLCFGGMNGGSGIRRRFEQGQYRMSTKRFMGYDYDKNGNLVVNKEQAKVVKQIYQEYLLGKTSDRIARELRAGMVNPTGMYLQSTACFEMKSIWVM